MTTMAVIILLTLTAVAILHVAWGLGASFPAADREDLFLLVVGATRRSEVPGLVESLLAAIAIFIAGLTAPLVSGALTLPLPSALITALGGFVTLVFLGRGLAPYTSVWRRHFSKEPFASLDRSWYGPFCLLLAVCFAILTIKRVTT
jgi:hypothetical protein